MRCSGDVYEKTSTSMFLTMFFKTQNIVQTMHLTMLIAHPYSHERLSYCRQLASWAARVNWFRIQTSAKASAAEAELEKSTSEMSDWYFTSARSWLEMWSNSDNIVKIFITFITFEIDWMSINQKKSSHHSHCDLYFSFLLKGYIWQIRASTVSVFAFWQTG